MHDSHDMQSGYGMYGGHGMDDIYGTEGVYTGYDMGGIDAYGWHQQPLRHKRRIRYVGYHGHICCFRHGWQNYRNRERHYFNRNHIIMEQKPVFISVCNQKGGIGKSTFTVLLADILHYKEGYRVLVVDCDYPQKSIFDQRKRELALLDRSPHYKSLLVRQFGMTHREIWPVIASTPEKALADMDRQLGMLREPVDFVLFDLPGTVGTPGVLRTLSAIDRIFVPMKADRYVMESTLAFAKSVEDHLVRKPDVPTAGIHLFWTMIDRRERTPLYDLYDKALEKLGLHRMETHIPYRSRFNKELSAEEGPVFRSTILLPEKSFIRECCLDSLTHEIVELSEHNAHGKQEKK